MSIFSLFFFFFFFAILPISSLQGFVSRHVGLFLKRSLWSLRVIKDSLSAVVLMRSDKSSFLSICRLYRL